MSRFEQTFFGYFDNLKRQMMVTPLNLGGIRASGGGGGGPPGGFIGLLPQTRVAYDKSEIALSGFPFNPYNPSGVMVSGSLLDNLNHIRYRLQILEGVGGGAIEVQDSGVPIESDVTVLNFGIGADVVDDGGGEVTINVSGGGGGGAETFLELTDVPSNYTSQAGKHVVVNTGETELEFVTASGSGGIEIQEEDASTATGVTIVNFEGSSVTTLDEGSGKVTVTVAASGEGGTYPRFVKPTHMTAQGSYFGWDHPIRVNIDGDAFILWTEELSTVYGTFIVPAGFSGTVGIEAVIFTFATGDIAIKNKFNYTDWGTDPYDSSVDTSATVTIGSTVLRKIDMRTFTSDGNELVNLNFSRYGAAAPDTLSSGVALVGWWVTYSG